VPITVTAPAGRLTPAGEREILPRLTDALLDATGARGNPFLTSIVGGTVHILDPRDVYAGGGNRPLVMVELKLPNVALADQEPRAQFIAAATRIVQSLCVEDHDPDDVWVNILHAPDGGWGIAGRAYTGDDLLAAASSAAAVAASGGQAST
jgi:phenylpyruvate tautomerase PptA (4-oxalocrotonate tautomerase family)